MLEPKKVKYRKLQKGRRRGTAHRGSTLAFGDFGLKAIGRGWMSAREIEAARVALTRYLKRGGKVWIRIFPDKPLTKKPLETRMDGTIPFEVTGRYGAGYVILKPASDGTGVIAGGGVRAVVEASGIQNVLTKCIGSNNPHNMVKATIEALRDLRAPEEIADRRGKILAEIR